MDTQIQCGEKSHKDTMKKNLQALVHLYLLTIFVSKKSTSI